MRVPTGRGATALECAFVICRWQKNLCRFAFSFIRQAVLHVSRTFVSPKISEANLNASGRFWPYITCAGDMPDSLSGVLRWDMMANVNASVFSPPLLVVWSRSNRFAVLTAASALPLLWGLWAEERRWRTPHARKKSWVSLEVNSVPPSLESSSGTPLSWNSRRRHTIRPLDPDAGVAGLAPLMSSITVYREKMPACARGCFNFII